MKHPVTAPGTMAHKMLAKWTWGWLVIVLLILATGCDTLTSTNPELDETGWFEHDKMAVVVSGSWMVGEYKVCQSYDSGKENGEPILTCDSDGREAAKRFKIAFHGSTYIASQPPDNYAWKPANSAKTTFSWDCRKNNDADLVFSCWRKAQDQPTNEGQAQTPTEHTHTELPQIEPALPEPVEECAVRFWNKLIHEINGKSVEAACKENPDLRP